MAHDAYFQGNPVRLDVSRSKMHAAPRWSGSWTIGRLVPIFATSSILPGDTFKMSVSSAIRMVRPVVPVMDDMDITIEAYFVPHRLVLSRKSMSPDLNDSNHSWAAFVGAQDSLLNMPTPGDIKLPCVAISVASGGSGDYLVGGLADCLGYHRPTVAAARPNCLKVLAYYSIWNEYWREPNTKSPVTYSINSGSFAETDSAVYLYGADAGITPTIPSGPTRNSAISDIPCAPVSRYHGYFGSALPWPQRNTSQVVMPLGNDAPVIAKGLTTADMHTMADGTNDKVLLGYTDSVGPNVIAGNVLLGANSGEGFLSSSSLTAAQSFSSSNLFADLSQATAATVNQFRLAVQTQRWFEALARCGNKYSDLVNGMFGVRGPSIPDRPEYLGGFTAPINISQVASTNGASGGAIGETGAFSLSNPGGYLFTKSFTEHGTLMIVACCRVRESFSQGVQREDYRFDRFDFFWTQYANLGEQPVYLRELYQTGTVDNANDKKVFGYQEAWAEYRMFNDQVTGYLNPGVTGNLGSYTYANLFSQAPDLKGYLDATGQQANVDRTVSVSAATAGFTMFGQFQFQIEMVRPMPTYSIPGLVDHH